MPRFYWLVKAENKVLPEYGGAKVVVTFVEIMWTEITGEMVSHQLAAHSEVLN